MIVVTDHPPSTRDLLLALNVICVPMITFRL
jgi:hypothetical protein